MARSNISQSRQSVVDLNSSVDMVQNTTNSLTCTEAALQITGDITYGCRVKVKNYSTASSYQTVMYQGAAGETEATNTLYMMGMTTSGKIKTLHEYGAGSNEDHDFANYIFPKNKWLWAIIRRDDSAKEYELFINGVSVDTVSYTNSATGGTTTSLNHVNIGISATSGADVKMNDWFVCNAALSDDEIASISRGEAGDFSGVTSIVEHWKLSEGATTAFTGTVSSYSLTKTGTIAYSLDTMTKSRLSIQNIEYSLRNTGTTQNVAIPADAAFTSQQYSASYWFRCNDGTQATQSLLTIWDGTASNRIIMGSRSTGFGGRIGLYDTTGGWKISSQYILPNIWYHVVVTADAVGDLVNIYINGSLNTSTALATALPTVDRVLLGTSTATGENIIGNYTDMRLWAGKILDATEVADLYFSGTVPSGVTGEWLMTEGSGSTVADTSGNGHNGTITSATWSTVTPSKTRTDV